MKEAYRDQRGLPFVETFVQDTRYGARALLRTPGFTVAALLTLALGIGANSAIFTVVNAILLRPLPYAEPDRILQMHRQSGGQWAGQTGLRYLYFRDHMMSFGALAAWRGTAFNMVVGDRAEQINALAVSKEYFRVFGGTPRYGRVFDSVEDQPNGPDAVILGHAIWRRMFGSNPSIIGSAISLGDRSFTVVGVMPEGFDSIRTAELYVPLQPAVTGAGGGLNYLVAGRLKTEVSPEQANAEARSVFDGYKSARPGTNFEGVPPPVFVLYQEGLSMAVRPALLMMLGAVGLLLLIACANTANLLLARASSRTREISVRAALGASRGRIVRQLVTESTVLFTTGGILGVALAYWSVPVLMQMTPPGYLPSQDVKVDATVLGVTLAVSVLTGVLFGLVPALSLSRLQPVEALKDDGSRTTSNRRSVWLRHLLVVGEVALCMILLVGAGLLIQTFLKLRALDPGFDARAVLTARMSLTGERYDTNTEVNRLYQLGLERLRKIPGVVSAAVVNGIPIEPGLNLNIDRLDTPDVAENGLTDWRYTSAEYFGTMGIPIVAGRGLNERDTTGAPRVTVVSEQFARQHYKGMDPIGQQFTVFKSDGPIEVVGIAKDLREAGLKGPVPALMYVPVAQAGDAAVRAAHAYFQVSWVVKASRLSPELVERIRAELRSLDPRQPVTAVRSIDEVKARAMANETFQMTLLTTFSGIGLLLAAAGIYGLIAYSVAQRTREFGIRLALGATGATILLAVLREGIVLAAIGIAVGMAASFAFTGALQAFVFGVSTMDAPTLGIVAAILLLVAVIASVVPAVRVVRLDAVSALRQG